MATQLPDGRWQARYRPKMGKPQVWYGETEEEAEKQKQDWLNPASIRSTGETALHEYAKSAWWPSVESGTKDGTVSKYETTYRLHVRPVFGRTPLNQIHYEDVQRWIAGMVKRGVSASEIKSRRAVLSMILNIAVRNDLISKNAASFAKVPKLKKRVMVMPIEKAAEVLAAVKGTNMAAPIFLGLVLGMRRGEACGLKWDNVDQAAHRITVSEQRRRMRRGAFEIVQASTKAESSNRSFVLPDTLWEMFLACGDLDGGWVCSARGHRPWNPEKMTERWKEIRIGLGLADWHYHDLRHAAGGLLAALGVDLLTIAAILGHSSIDSTMLYAAAQEATATKGLKALGDALNLQKK